jgi:hypothetical protein
MPPLLHRDAVSNSNILIFQYNINSAVIDQAHRESFRRAGSFLCNQGTQSSASGSASHLRPG